MVVVVVVHVNCRSRDVCGSCMTKPQDTLPGGGSGEEEEEEEDPRR